VPVLLQLYGCLAGTVTHVIKLLYDSYMLLCAVRRLVASHGAGSITEGIMFYKVIRE
jgi:hypothetical protein